MSGIRMAPSAVAISFGLILSLFIPIGSPAQAPASGQVQPPFWSSKPDVAAFDRIENERLAAVQKSVDQITAVTGLRTVENTLVPYDEAQRQIGSAAGPAGLKAQASPAAAFRDSGIR